MSFQFGTKHHTDCQAFDTHPDQDDDQDEPMDCESGPGPADQPVTPVAAGPVAHPPSDPADPADPAADMDTCNLCIYCDVYTNRVDVCPDCTGKINSGLVLCNGCNGRLTCKGKLCKYCKLDYTSECRYCSAELSDGSTVCPDCRDELTRGYTPCNGCHTRLTRGRKTLCRFCSSDSPKLVNRCPDCFKNYRVTYVAGEFTKCCAHREQAVDLQRWDPKKVLKMIITA